MLLVQPTVEGHCFLDLCVGEPSYRFHFALAVLNGSKHLVRRESLDGRIEDRLDAHHLGHPGAWRAVGAMTHLALGFVSRWPADWAKHTALTRKTNAASTSWDWSILLIAKLLELDRLRWRSNLKT